MLHWFLNNVNNKFGKIITLTYLFIISLIRVNFFYETLILEQKITSEKKISKSTCTVQLQCVLDSYM